MKKFVVTITAQAEFKCDPRNPDEYQENIDQIISDLEDIELYNINVSDEDTFVDEDEDEIEELDF